MTILKHKKKYGLNIFRINPKNSIIKYSYIFLLGFFILSNGFFVFSVEIDEVIKAQSVIQFQEEPFTISSRLIQVQSKEHQTKHFISFGKGDVMTGTLCGLKPPKPEEIRVLGEDLKLDARVFGSYKGVEEIENEYNFYIRLLQDNLEENAEDHLRNDAFIFCGHGEKSIVAAFVAAKFKVRFGNKNVKLVTFNSPPHIDIHTATKIQTILTSENIINFQSKYRLDNRFGFSKRFLPTYFSGPSVKVGFLQNMRDKTLENSLPENALAYGPIAYVLAPLLGEAISFFQDVYMDKIAAYNKDLWNLFSSSGQDPSWVQWVGNFIGALYSSTLYFLFGDQEAYKRECVDACDARNDDLEMIKRILATAYIGYIIFASQYNIQEQSTISKTYFSGRRK